MGLVHAMRNSCRFSRHIARGHAGAKNPRTAHSYLSFMVFKQLNCYSSQIYLYHMDLQTQSGAIYQLLVNFKDVLLQLSMLQKAARRTLAFFQFVSVLVSVSAGVAAFLSPAWVDQSFFQMRCEIDILGVRRTRRSGSTRAGQVENVEVCFMQQTPKRVVWFCVVNLGVLGKVTSREYLTGRSLLLSAVHRVVYRHYLPCVYHLLYTAPLQIHLSKAYSTAFV